MAALLILGALTLKQKVDDRKERKRQKKLHDNERYRELQAASIVGSSKEKHVTHPRRDSVDSDAHSHSEKVDTTAATLPPEGHDLSSGEPGEISAHQTLPVAAARQDFQRTASGRLIDI